jgi:hypothetical protein
MIATAKLDPLMEDLLFAHIAANASGDAAFLVGGIDQAVEAFGGIRADRELRRQPGHRHPGLRARRPGTRQEEAMTAAVPAPPPLDAGLEQPGRSRFRMARDAPQQLNPGVRRLAGWLRLSGDPCLVSILASWTPRSLSSTSTGSRS